jgi:hypothetical protein
MIVRRVIRTISAIFIGMFLISGLVEGLEFGLVAAIHGAPTTEPEVYYGIRNLAWFLSLKLVYNTAAAVVGGFVTALVAGYAPLKHGIALACIQTLAFAWGLTQPNISQWTPGWVWAGLIVFSFAGILFGARIWEQRARSDEPVPGHFQG